MFRWCSYCQNLIGEAEPLSDYRVSHGICVKCSQDQVMHTSNSDLLRARSIFDMLVKAGQGASLDASERIIEEALDFGLKPSDIIVGILHPALYRIGELWERGEISVADEHRFTAFALGLIDRLTFPEPPNNRPLIILANHPESLHDVGLRIVQILSWEHGVPCERIPAGSPEATLLMAASERSPNLFGLSVSLMETIPAAVELAESIARRLPDSSRVVLGGQAFRRCQSYGLPDSVVVMESLDEFLAQLRSIKAEYPEVQDFDDPDPRPPER